MTGPEWTFFWWVPPASLIVLAVSLVATVWRLVRGPTLPDRIVALDLFATQLAGILGVYALAMNSPVLLHVAVIIALILFIGTVAFANYLEKGVKR
jgi:multicomponent Na+:H+ antiporter subunit F